MGEKVDKAKGKVKETAGEMTDDDRLRREGKLDRAGGTVKGVAHDAKDKVDRGVDRAKRAGRDALDR